MTEDTCEKSPICIIAATRLEAMPFVEAFGLEENKEGPITLFEGKDIALAVSGIGKTNAAIATTYCCMAFRPGRILNLGAAGAAKSTFSLGEIFHITSVIEYDRPHFARIGLRYHRPHVLPGFREASLATQDRPVTAPSHRAEVAPFADLVDMEGAAVVQAARRFRTPCLLFKFVSDTPDDPGEADIVEYIGRESVKFCRFVAESVIPVLKQASGPGR